MKRSLRRPFMQWFTNLIRNSRYRWLIVLGSLVYLVSPLDISPDVFPVVGWIDDGLLATLVVTELTQMVLERRRKLGEMPTPAPSNVNAETAIDVESVTVS